MEINNQYLNEYLPIYYRRLFPHSLYYDWLRYGEDNLNFSHREFSFTIENDVYIRYLSFTNQQEFEKELIKKNPFKFDIGAIYNCRPRDKIKFGDKFVPKYRELVFDIDMTDYDEIRNCCKKCWPFMIIAIKILNIGLKDDFGFNNILWVYSGRRGVHCWVCDEIARKLDNNVRKAIAEYFTLIMGGEKRVSLEDPIHPSISRAFNIIKPYFEKLMLEDEDLLGNEEKCEKVLEMIRDKDLRYMVKKELSTNDKLNTSTEKWNALSKIVSRETSKGKYLKSQKCRQEIILQCCYPRLDVNVTTNMNHLLKSPFSIHPKTGKVCVPINPDEVDDFDPFKVPTIEEICEELNHQVLPSSSNKHLKDYEKTSLNPGIKVFERFVKTLNQRGGTEGESQ